MDEDENAEFFALAPERMELRIGELVARAARAHRRAAKSELLHGVFELFGGEVRKLKRDRSERDDAVGVRGAVLHEPLVVDPHDLDSRVAVGLVPIGIDADRLDVDALLVHLPYAALADLRDSGTALALGLEPDHRERLGNHAMTMHVDGLDALAVDRNFAAPRRS